MSEADQVGAAAVVASDSLSNHKNNLINNFFAALPSSYLTLRIHSDMCTVRTTNNCKDVSAWLGPLVAAWLLFGYVLPDTIFSYLSPVAGINVEQLIHNCPLWTIAGVPIILSCCLLVRPLSKSSSSLLWLSTSLLCFMYSYQAVCIRVADLYISASCLGAVLALSVGLLCVRLCKRLESLVSILALLCSIQAIYSILYCVVGTHHLISGDIQRAGGTFNRPNYLYAVMLFALPPTLALLYQTTSRLKLLWGFCVLLMITALALTWYRGGLLGILIGGTWTFNRIVTDKRYVIIVFALLLSLFLVSAYVRTSDYVNRESSKNSLIGRSVLWQAGWNVFATHSITGVGIGKLRLLVRNSHGNEAVYRQPQNIELQWIDELGLWGGALFLIFMVTITNEVRNTKTPMSAGIGGAWMALLVAGQTDTPFGVTDRIFSFALLGVLLGITILLRQKSF